MGLFKFLSCLCGSDLYELHLQMRSVVSKLPMRQ